MAASVYGPVYRVGIVRGREPRGRRSESVCKSVCAERKEGKRRGGCVREKKRERERTHRRQNERGGPERRGCCDE